MGVSMAMGVPQTMDGYCSGKSQARMDDKNRGSPMAMESPRSVRALGKQTSCSTAGLTRNNVARKKTRSSKIINPNVF